MISDDKKVYDIAYCVLRIFGVKAMQLKLLRE